MGERIAFVIVAVWDPLNVVSNWGLKFKIEGESVGLSPPSNTDTMYGWLPDPFDESVNCIVKFSL